MRTRFRTKVAVRRAMKLRPEFAALMDKEQAARLGMSPSRWSQIQNGYLKAENLSDFTQLCKGLEMDMATFLRLGGMSEEKVEVLVPGTKLSGIAGGSGQDDVDTGGKVVAMRRKAKVKSVANQHLQCEPEAVAA